MTRMTTRYAALVLASLSISTLLLRSQSPASDRSVGQAGSRIRSFEVATIKPSDPNKCCDRTFSRPGRRFQTTNTNLKYLIQWAWNLQANQVVGGPPWIDQDRFDVAGEIDGTDEPTDREWKLAVRNLLADRFQLTTHTETHFMPAYVLTVAKDGPKLRSGDGNPDIQRMGFSGATGQPMYGIGKNASMADFIGELQRIVLNKPVIDRTGLTGRYDINIEFTREDPSATGMTDLPDTAPPNLFTALTQQLGLKLEAARGPVPVLVIDSARKPSAN